MKGVMMDYHVYAVVGAVIALDILVGLMKAGLVEGFSSQKMREGLGHKFTYIVALALAALIEWGSVYLDFGFQLTVLQPAVTVYIVLTEVGSILENIVAINPALSDNAFLSIFTKKGGTDAED